MTATEEITKWVIEFGSERDALNVALARLAAAEANLSAMTDKAGDEFERAEAAEARAARLTEALQFHGDESNYQNETVDIGVGDMLIPSSNRVDNDGGQIARATLSASNMQLTETEHPLKTAARLSKLKR